MGTTFLIIAAMISAGDARATPSGEHPDLGNRVLVEPGPGEAKSVKAILEAAQRSLSVENSVSYYRSLGEGIGREFPYLYEGNPLFLLLLEKYRAILERLTPKQRQILESTDYGYQGTMKLLQSTPVSSERFFNPGFFLNSQEPERLVLLGKQAIESDFRAAKYLYERALFIEEKLKGHDAEWLRETQDMLKWIDGVLERNPIRRVQYEELDRRIQKDRNRFYSSDLVLRTTRNRYVLNYDRKGGQLKLTVFDNWSLRPVAERPIAQTPIPGAHYLVVPYYDEGNGVVIIYAANYKLTLDAFSLEPLAFSEKLSKKDLIVLDRLAEDHPRVVDRVDLIHSVLRSEEAWNAYNNVFFGEKNDFERDRSILSSILIYSDNGHHPRDQILLAAASRTTPGYVIEVVKGQFFVTDRLRCEKPEIARKIYRDFIGSSFLSNYHEYIEIFLCAHSGRNPRTERVLEHFLNSENPKLQARVLRALNDIYESYHYDYRKKVIELVNETCDFDVFMAGCKYLRERLSPLEKIKGLKRIYDAETTPERRWSSVVYDINEISYDHPDLVREYFSKEIFLASRSVNVTSATLAILLADRIGVEINRGKSERSSLPVWITYSWKCKTARILGISSF